MKARAFRTLVIPAAAFFVLGLNEPPPAVSVRTAFFERPAGAACLLSITNHVPSKLTGVQIALYQPASRAFATQELSLAANQSKVVEFGIASKGDCVGPDAIIRVRYIDNGVADEAVISQPAAEGFRKPWLTENVGPVITGLLAIFSALIGGYAVHRLTMQRERLLWRTKQFEREEPAYREFLARWGSQAEAHMLKVNFDDLERKVFVADAVFEGYQKLLGTLQSDAATQSEKALAAATFSNQVRTYMRALIRHMETA
jgi:hypothetical protein